MDKKKTVERNVSWSTLGLICVDNENKQRMTVLHQRLMEQAAVDLHIVKRNHNLLEKLVTSFTTYFYLTTNWLFGQIENFYTLKLIMIKKTFITFLRFYHVSKLIAIFIFSNLHFLLNGLNGQKVVLRNINFYRNRKH